MVWAGSVSSCRGPLEEREGVDKLTQFGTCPRGCETYFGGGASAKCVGPCGYFERVVSTEESSALEQRFRDATAALDAASTDAFEKLLRPFAETFAHLHEVTLGDLPTNEAVPELDDVDAKARETAATVLRDLIVGDAGRVLHAALLLGIQTVSKSPNLVGKAVRLNPGAWPGGVAEYWNNSVVKSRAARPQIEAFFRQTQRNLGKNKTLYIAGSLSVAAVAGLVWAWNADTAEYEAKLEEERRQKLDKVAERRAELLDALNLDRLRFASERAEEATDTLTQLVELGVGRLPALRALVATSTDYFAYANSDRLLVAELAGLAQTTAAVIATSVDVQVPQELEDSQAPTLEAARRIVSRHVRDRNPGTDAAPVISWVTGQINTTQQRQQLAYLAQQPEYLQRLAKRCGNTHQRVQEGFYFEWRHELGFNLDAIGKDSPHRAYVTEWLGRPADPADIVVHTSDGKVVSEVQAKVVESNSKRVGPRNGLIDPNYEGKVLLVPTDHVDRTHATFDKLAKRPATSLNRERYEDARERLTDTVSYDGISSDPITTGKLTEATNDPQGHLQQIANDIELRRTVHAAVTAGGAAAATSLTTDLLTHLFTEGTFVGFNWAQAGVASARTSAATTVAAAAGTYLQGASERAVASGSTNFLLGSLAEGDHGPAITQAAVDIAAIAHGLATGRLTQAEAAEAAGEAIVRSAINWVCTAVVRNTISDSEVAALVGGFVGQYGSKLIVYGIRVAVLGRDPDRRWDDAYDALLADTISLERACVAEGEELIALGRQHRIAFTEHVLPALEDLMAGSGMGDGTMREVDPDAQLVALAAIANQFAGTPLFDSLEAFDAFMADANRTLALGTSRE